MTKFNNDCKRKIQQIIRESLPTYSKFWDDILNSLVNILPNSPQIECFHKSAFDIINKWISTKSKEDQNKTYQYISDWTTSYEIYDYFNHCNLINKEDTLSTDTSKVAKLNLENKYSNFSARNNYQYKSILYWPNENNNSI